MLAPLSEGRDTLDGLHSNTQIPKFVGFQRVHELTAATRRIGAAARFFWKTVVERRSFVTGGNGDGEHFFPVTDFAKHLGSAKTMETCCTHNMLRLTRAAVPGRAVGGVRRLLRARALQRHPRVAGPRLRDDDVFPGDAAGYVRLYHTPDESFWCCTGTGMENHAKYGDSIYFHDADAL